MDVCLQCHGIWFDVGEMKRIAAAGTPEAIDTAFEGTFTKQPVAEAIATEERLCPVEGDVLVRHEWGDGSGIVMDWCQICGGTWLDAGELEGYVAALQSLAREMPEVASELKRSGVTPSRQEQQWKLAEADKQNTLLVTLLRPFFRNLLGHY